MTKEEEAKALEYDPWGERDATYRVVSNKFVTTRKPHDCSICFVGIPIGDRVRASSEVDDGKARTFYFCETCSSLMPFLQDIGVFEQLSDRYDIGRRNAKEMRSYRARSQMK